ncbi:MAG: hypothetical protein B0A82_02235 [Alkalinema sp. CACIAM 70d]|nr:MAG: hypothetical protein B0A82_02235 [Alkalinema sp. CACIAM 70d]
MTAAEKLYQLLQILPEQQITEVLHFAEFLHQKQLSPPPTSPPGTLISEDELPENESDESIAAGLRRSLQEFRDGQAIPLANLWDGIDVAGSP